MSYSHAPPHNGSDPTSSGAHDPEDSLIGTVFAKDFRVLRRLRSGGMGSVFVVEQMSTGKERALKLLAPGLAEHPDIRERFVREARAASAIDSDHVVEIVSAGVDDTVGAPYLVMELLRGEDLGDRIENAGPMTADEMVDVLCQVGHGLELAHRQGIVHRDLKPENIFLANSRRGDGVMCAKILDFGVAKLLTGNAGTAGTLPVGSPGYMAPEQTDTFGNITPAADVWSLGLVAFYLLTGRSYWQAGLEASVPALLREVCFDPIDPPSVRARALGIDTQLPEGFDEWFCRCVDREIEARFPDAGHAVRALATLAGSAAASARDKALPGHEKTPATLDASADRSSSNQGLSLPPRAGTSSPTFAAKAGRAAAVVAGFGVLAGAIGGLAAFALVGHPAHDESAAKPADADATSSAEAAAPSATAAPRNAGALRSAAAPLPGASTAVPKARPTKPTAAPPMRVIDSGPCGPDMSRHLRNGADPGFCMDRREVTVRAYLECVTKGACEPLRGESRADNQPSKFSANYSLLCNVEASDLPVNCLSLSSAQRYCRYAGKALPTEAQWERAARSPRGPFPWGDAEADATLLNACGDECRAWGYREGIFLSTMYEESDGFESAAPVGSFPGGMAEGGELDLLGNVAEWVTDARGDAPTARGGSFLSHKSEQLTERLQITADSTSHVVGFRCARPL